VGQPKLGYFIVAAFQFFATYPVLGAVLYCQAKGMWEAGHLAELQLLRQIKDEHRAMRAQLQQVSVGDACRRRVWPAQLLVFLGCWCGCLGVTENKLLSFMTEDVINAKSVLL
jgi:hypothetical protein